MVCFNMQQYCFHSAVCHCMKRRHVIQHGVDQTISGKIWLLCMEYDLANQHECHGHWQIISCIHLHSYFTAGSNALLNSVQVLQLWSTIALYLQNQNKWQTNWLKWAKFLNVLKSVKYYIKNTLQNDGSNEHPEVMEMHDKICTASKTKHQAVGMH